MNTTSNAVRKDEYQIISFQQAMKAAKPVFLTVDKEVMDLTFYLLKEEETQATGGSKQHIFVNTPKLTKLTFAAFLQKGIKGQVRGLDSLLKEEDYVMRREGLRTLAALYSVFKRKEATTFEKVTPEMMAAAFARLDRDNPAASQDWIDSYKARMEVAFEGKDARMQKKVAFCAAINQEVAR